MIACSGNLNSNQHPLSASVGSEISENQTKSEFRMFPSWMHIATCEDMGQELKAKLAIVGW